MPRPRWATLTVTTALGLLLAACSGFAAPTATPQPTNTPAPPIEVPRSSPTPAPTLALNCSQPFEGQEVPFNPRHWPQTDFCQHTVEYDEIMSGGVPRDGIPSIDDPQFESPEAGDDWLGEQWPVMSFELNGDARAYPLAILVWHEIVNDVVDGEAVALTYCPLCNSSIAFRRVTPDGRTLEFGVSGFLRSFDLIMYDRQTHSWWQQLTGQGIVGFYAGEQLEFLASRIVSWGDFKAQHPQGQVLSRDTGNPRRYGSNPYPGLDNIAGSPFAFNPMLDDRLPAVERVAAVELDGSSMAYPFSQLRTLGVVNDEVGETPMVVFWQPGVLSALDSQNMEYSRDVGSTAVFERAVDDQVLTFTPLEDGFFEDEQTGSRWSFFGQAVDGPLSGSALTPVVHGEHFWFAWAAFQPGVEIWKPDEN